MLGFGCGASLEEVCKYGMTKECGLIVNSSRAIIYADKTENIALHNKQEQLKKQIEKLEKQARAEKQPKKKFELVQKLKKLKKHLVSV